jgi:nitroreductase
MINIREVFNYRYACKNFDINKKVEQKYIDDILLSANLSPSSFGLEPWRFIIVKKDDIKQQLFEASYYQKQVKECDFVIAIIARVDFSKDDDYINECANRLEENSEKYAKICRDFFENKTKENILNWANRQCFIAGANMMSVGAMHKIDSCPMEGFVVSKVAKILSLKNSEYPSLIIPFGYRLKNMQPRTKIRWSLDRVVKYIK